MIPQETTLETGRFRLRIPNEQDIDFVFSASQYPNFTDGMGWKPPKHKDELYAPLERGLEAWKRGEGYGFTIETKEETPLPIGRISIRKTADEDVWNIGFWVHPEQQNRGVMTEVVWVILNFGFSTLQAKIITAAYAIWNKASEKVLLKNGFKFSHHIKKGLFKHGNWIAENELAIHQEAFFAGEKMTPTSCEFCSKLIENKNTIFENDSLVVLLDIDPIALGHVLICPKTHYTDFHELPDELMTEMMRLAKEYIILLDSVFATKGYSLMLNAGEYNDLQHCHLHVFPRNYREEFQWQYNDQLLHKDATKFEVLKKLFAGHL